MTRIRNSAPGSALCLLIACLAAAGCAGGNAIDAGVPSSAIANNGPEAFPSPAQPGGALVPAAQTATPPPTNALATGVAANTGTFPDSGVARQAATSQLADDERDRMIAELQALKNQQQANTVSSAANRARLLELQRLAQTHSRDTIARIEAQ